MPAPTPSRPRPSRTALALLGAVGLALTAACSTGTPDEGSDAAATAAAPEQTPTVLPSAPVTLTPADVPDCLPDGVAAAQVGEAPATTTVAWAGSGDRGVVLAPQVDGDVCQWADELVRLAGEGYLVATYAWGTSGEAGFASAVDVLEATGATRLAFVGASAGGTLAAGLADDLGATAVVALSPPAQYGEVDARAASSTFTGPLQVFASTEDPQVPLADSTQVARQDKTSVTTQIPGTAHGVEFLAGAHADHVRTVVDEALTQGFGG
ncbi:alpha/beta hydrolase family protein [Cellulomonas sp. NPDC057328]|uniref:alpha/beta hydrolase family protein n=1 Tax=Cellulomonas sp. NPDC057328 TaxID=3346101 RepID=UPI00364542B9